MGAATGRDDGGVDDHDHDQTPDQHQRLLAGPGFPDDTGEAEPALVAALAAYDAAPRDPDTYLACLEVLRTARLLVPVVALLGEVEVDERGLAHDKSSDMAAVLLTGADGRTALLSFTGTAAMTAWDPHAARAGHRAVRRPGRGAGGCGGAAGRRRRPRAAGGAGRRPRGAGRRVAAGAAGRGHRLAATRRGLTGPGSGA